MASTMYGALLIAHSKYLFVLKDEIYDLTKSSKMPKLTPVSFDSNIIFLRCFDDQ